MTITKTTLPKESILNVGHKKYDFVDSFRGVLNDDKDSFSTVDIGKAFFSSGPKWVGKLFALRNGIASFLGLKTAGNKGDIQKHLENFSCEPGEQLGLFKVFDKSENEIILGEDDKHLNFRVSLFVEHVQSSELKKELTITTTVVFNNCLNYFPPFSYWFPDNFVGFGHA
ncbi:MAG: DUF2867 domain-containing protein [Prolixibacteraceae bacterium]|jgi:hypothetical protein|nr:DUF2867 domain-containing protein [Prolixibacteraceae bacterium]